MAGIALLVCGHMVGVFAYGNVAVVTARTGADDLRVVDQDCRRPCGVEMTGFAQLSRQNMLLVFACGGVAIVTAGAITIDL